MKDPAFPFYAQDFLTGVMHFNMAERGIYITLLSYQWAHGKIPKKRLGFILGSNWETCWEAVSEKFVEKGDFLTNVRLEEEREKRAQFKEKQRENGKKGGRKPKQNPTATQTISQAQSQKKPLDNEDEYEKENDTEKAKEGIAEKPDCEAVIKMFNSVCAKLPEVKKLTAPRRAAIKNRVAEVGLSGLENIFGMVAQSHFLNGENDRGWTADFDWIMKPANFIKILEGKYKNSNNAKQLPAGKGRYEVSDTLKQKIAERLQSGELHEAFREVNNN